MSGSPVLVLLLAVVGDPPAFAEPCDATVISTGELVDVSLAGGSNRRFAFHPDGPGRWVVEARQHGIDIELGVTSKRATVRVNSPTGRDGRDTVVLDTDRGESLCIELTAAPRTAGRGVVGLRVDAVVDGAGGGNALVSLARHLSAADAAYADNRIDAFDTALEHYRRAAEIADESGLSEYGARARHSRAKILSELGRNSDAAEAFHAAAVSYRSQGEYALAAWAYGYEGLALVYVGRYAEAGTPLALSRELFASGDNRYGLAIVDNSHCLLRHYQGNYRDALTCYRSVADELRALRELSDLAVVTNNIGRVLDLTGSPGEARDAYRQALDIHGKADNQGGAAQTLNNLGLLERRLGNFQAAIGNYQQALDIQQALGNDLERAVLLHNIGLAYYYLGEGKRALRFLERALPLRRRVGDRKGEASTLNGIGTVTLRLGRNGEAAEFFRQSYAIRMELGDRAGQARAYLRLGESLGGEREDTLALSYIDRAQEIFGEAGDLRSAAEAHYRRAVILERHDIDAAAREYRSAIGTWLDVDDPLGVARATLGMARIERRNGRLGNALTFVNDSIAQTESSRNKIVDPRLRGAFLGTRQDAYRMRVEVLMAMEAEEPDAGHAVRALLANDRRMARTFGEILYQRNVARASGRDNATTAVSELERRLNRSTSELSQLVARDADASEIRSKRRQIDNYLTKLQSQNAGQAGFGDSVAKPADAASLGEIQDGLRDDELILHFFVGDRGGYVWAIDAESVTSYSIPRKAEVDAAVDLVVDALHRPVAGGDCARLSAAADLGDMLLRPIYPRLSRYSGLVIVADGSLTHVPFSVLAGAPRARSARQDCYTSLVESVTIAYLPSLLAGEAAEDDGVSAFRSDGDVLVVSDAVYTRSDGRFSAQVSRRETPMAAAPGATTRAAVSLERLYWSSKEAAEILSVAGHETTRSLAGFGALKSSFMSLDLSAYRIVHLALHGLFDARQPDIASLVFGLYRENGEAIDGYLTLADVVDLRLDASLVVLSGCSTALGEDVDGEGLIGLTRAMMQSGAAMVVSSLWNVDDAATAELMAAFYEELLVAHRAPPVALQRAKLKIRAQPQWRDPFFWSGFTLHRSAL